jgi:Tol biopolymer transport system component
MKTATSPAAPSLTPVPAQTETPLPTATLDAVPFTLNELKPGEYLGYWERAKGQFSLLNRIDLSSQKLMEADSPPAWLSPDGSKIAFYHQDQIQIYDLSTGVIAPIPQPNIFSSSELAFGGLTWSPDSKKVAFAASTIQIAEDDTLLGVEEFPSIWVSFLDENRFERLTAWFSIETSPAWSPDGRWLAFAADHEKVKWARDNQIQGEFVGSADIYILETACLEQPDACLGKARVITSGSLEEDGSHPIWSPDSTQIAYTCGIQERVDNSKLTFYQTDICLVDVEGNTTNLTDTPEDRDLLPLWSPDGTAIAYIRQHQYSTHDIFWINLTGTEIVNVTGSPTWEETRFLWSRDSSSIVFSQDGTVGIFVAELDGSSIKQLIGIGAEPLFWLVVK